MRKGFTLVELLIVIVVIGILSSMMMLSTTEALSSAKAAKIINDLSVIKTAVISWYADNYERVKKEAWNGTFAYKVDGKFLGEFAQTPNGKKEILKYIGNNNSVNVTKDNSTKMGEFLLATEGDQWFVGYDVGTDMKVREKLAAKAQSLRLQGATKKTNSSGAIQADTDNIHLFTVNDQKAYMLIMQF